LKKTAVSLIVFALLVQLFGYYPLAKKIEPFMYQFYIIVWWSFIILLDASLALKTKRFLILNKHLGFLVIVSVAFWCLFELVNLRLQNWFYINVPYRANFRVAGYILAFGTVIPAIYLVKEILSHFIPDIKVKPVNLSHYPAYVIPLGIVCLVLSLVFPTYFFSVAWVFLAFIVDGYNYRRGYPSFGKDIERGSLKQIIAASLSGMICGFLWELWNYWSITKWVYTVPYFEDLKIFEMPLLGYLGFAFFAIETIAFTNLLDRSPFVARSRWSVSLFALAFSLFSFFLIDRHTVFSYAPTISRLSFLSLTTQRELEKKRIETSYAIDPRMLSREERESLALMQLKGLGLENFIRLREQGIHTVKGLSELDLHRFSSIIGENNLRRARVYMKAARSHSRVQES
jgi:hypothetical protein